MKTFYPDQEFNTIEEAIKEANELSYSQYGAYFFIFKDFNKYFITKYINSKCEYASFKGKESKDFQ